MARYRFSRGFHLPKDESDKTPRERATVVAEIALTNAVEQLSRTFGASDSLDNKATALLGLSAVILALILKLTWGPWIAIPGVLLLSSMIFSMRVLWRGELENGPQVKEFYERYSHATKLDATLFLTSEINYAYDENNKYLRKSGTFINIALMLLIGTFISAFSIYLIEGVDNGVHNQTSKIKRIDVRQENSISGYDSTWKISRGWKGTAENLE